MNNTHQIKLLIWPFTGERQTPKFEKDFPNMEAALAFLHEHENDGVIPAGESELFPITVSEGGTRPFNYSRKEYFRLHVEYFNLETLKTGKIPIPIHADSLEELLEFYPRVQNSTLNWNFSLKTIERVVEIREEYPLPKGEQNPMTRADYEAEIECLRKALRKP